MSSFKLSKLFSLKDLVLLSLACACFTLAGYINVSVDKPKIELSKQDSALNVNRNILLFFNLGNKRLFSNLLWIQTLIESDEQHYKKNDLSSWMYLRFLSISTLDPLFYENYLYGGQLLSIIKDDLAGAEDIYARGLSHYPDDFELNYHSGFNLYFEMGKFQEGLMRFKKIQHHPQATLGLNFLINKLEFVTGGDYNAALDFLRLNYSMSKDPTLKTKIEKDIYALKAERDLKCLNSNGEACEKLDANNVPYVFQNGLWKTQTSYTPYRIYRQKGMPQADPARTEK